MILTNFGPNSTKKAALKSPAIICETGCLLVAAPSFSVDLNPRLGCILRFRSTVNEASFYIGIGGLGLRRLDYPC